MIYNGNRTEWSTIQEVIGEKFQFEIKSTITHELYDTKSYYQLIVTTTKSEKNTTVDKLFDYIQRIS